MSDNVIGLGSDADDWYTMGQLKRAVSKLAQNDLSKEPYRVALEKEKGLYKGCMERFRSLGRS